MLSKRQFETRLRGRLPPPPTCAPARAAVAAILRFDRDAPDVLLMKRATRPGDRWSGQVSLPGGREEPVDADLVATAIRETREEVGLDLARRGRLLGGLPPTRAIARGAVLPLAIVPFVFELVEPAPLALNAEAAAAFWLPLDRAVAGELDATHRYRLGPVEREFPCWRYEGHDVWGLTYRMLRDLLDVVTRG